MHIDFQDLRIETESDVEQKILMPLLCGDAYLSIPGPCIFTKQYLAPTILDKAANKTGAYFPDYSVWLRGLLVMVVEAKAPDVAVEAGYREASLYAQHINQNYPKDVNPCRFILVSNGKQLLFGYWDFFFNLLGVRPISRGRRLVAQVCQTHQDEAHAKNLQHGGGPTGRALSRTYLQKRYLFRTPTWRRRRNKAARRLKRSEVRTIGACSRRKSASARSGIRASSGPPKNL